MNFLIITHVVHKSKDLYYYAYAPYIREMNIWLKNVDKVTIVAPLDHNAAINPIDIPYLHKNIEFISVPSFDLTNFRAILKSTYTIPYILWVIFKQMLKADHTHLRCPGNMGLLGSFIQMFLPFKRKTAKYASNWDVNSVQPLSYKLQRWILNNTFLSKNLKVMVYGDWNNSSSNVASFFTATYYENEKRDTLARPLTNLPIKFVFVGTLTSGKKPYYGIHLMEQLTARGFDVQLKMYGEGNMQDELQIYIDQNNLNNKVFLMGNVNKEQLIEVYSHAHFLILQSGSFEGWPKVVAESMFWGCVPLAIPTSVVPQMLDNGNRGILMYGNMEKDLEALISLLKDESHYLQMSKKAMAWSRNYTLDKFEAEIYKLIHG